jgi:hypothetical protein
MAVKFQKQITVFRDVCSEAGIKYQRKSEKET